MDVPYVKKQVELKKKLEEIKEDIDSKSQEISSIYTKIEENENQLAKIERKHNANRTSKKPSSSFRAII